MVPGSVLTDPPLAPAVLTRLVLRWRRDVPSASLGAHQRRRQGHSLEFREYRLWQRGDDIRSVDWRASLRQPRRGNLLLRSYEAEERLALAILVDNRPGMALPETMPRLLWALWAARALAMRALEKGDDVILACLCAGAAEPVLELRGPEAQARLRAWAEALWHGRDRVVEGFADLDQIAAKMRPAGATVLISDMLFEDEAGRLRRFAHQMQRRRQSFSVVQLDSTAHEIALLRAAGVFHLTRPGAGAGDEMQLFDEAAMTRATDAITGHLQKMRQILQGGGLDWPHLPVVWPEMAASEGELGLEQLKALFAQSFPQLPLLAGLGLGGGPA